MTHLKRKKQRFNNLVTDLKSVTIISDALVTFLEKRHYLVTDFKPVTK